MKIKEFRQARGMTQQALADAVHVTKGAVSQWENGLRVPEVSTLLALADVFGVSLDTLVGRQPPEAVS